MDYERLLPRVEELRHLAAPLFGIEARTWAQKLKIEASRGLRGALTGDGPASRERRGTSRELSD